MFKTPKRFGMQGIVCDLISICTKDKDLEARLNRLKPKIMVFDTSVNNSNGGQKDIM